MKKLIETPGFKSENEEVLWWEKNQNAILNEFKREAKEGTLGRVPRTIRESSRDVEGSSTC